MTAGAIVLAAGRSTRMGSTKLLADLDGRPLIAHVVDALAAAGLPPPVVVLGHDAAAVRLAVGPRPATFVVAADYAAGMSRSLVAGLAAVPPEWRAALICLGDMPRVAPATLAALAAASREEVVAIPVWQGRRGNPVCWSRAHFAALAAVTGDSGGRHLLATLPVIEVAATSDGVLLDVDTPQALAALRSAPG